MRKDVGESERRAVAWLTVVIRRAGNRARRRYTEHAHEFPSDTFENAPRLATSWEDDLLDQLTVESAWRGLSDFERWILGETVVKQTRQLQIARKLGVSQGRISQHKTQALQHLRRLIGEDAHGLPQNSGHPVARR